jgi:hypothetical protein
MDQCPAGFFSVHVAILGVDLMRSLQAVSRSCCPGIFNAVADGGPLPGERNYLVFVILYAVKCADVFKPVKDGGGKSAK